MGKIVAVFNQKGGVGKTATINNLAFELKERGKKVLIVDADQQENLSASLGVIPRTCNNTIYDLLRFEIYDEPYSKDLSGIIVHTDYGIDLIPGSVQMAVMDKMLFSLSRFPSLTEKFLSDFEANNYNLQKKAEEADVDTAIKSFARIRAQYVEAEKAFLDIMKSAGLVKDKNGDLIIKKILEPVRDNYDYILIDCPPALSAITVNILSAADRVLVTMSPEPFAASGLTHLITSVNLIQKQTNPNLRFSGLLYTMVEKNRRLVDELIRQASAVYGQLLYIYKTVIPRSTDVNKAFANSMPLIQYNKRNPARIAYSDFCDEFLKREEQ